MGGPVLMCREEVKESHATDARGHWGLTGHGISAENDSKDSNSNRKQE